MTKYVYNNAVPYRSSHHLPVTVERSTHTAIECKNLTFKMELVSITHGATPYLAQVIKAKDFSVYRESVYGESYQSKLTGNKRKVLLKTTVQLPQDYTRRFGTPTWSPLYRQGDQYCGHEDEEMRGPGHSAVSLCPDTSFHPAPVINPRNVMCLHWNILLSLAVELLGVHIWRSDVFHLCE